MAPLQSRQNNTQTTFRIQVRQIDFFTIFTAVWGKIEWNILPTFISYSTVIIIIITAGAPDMVHQRTMKSRWSRLSMLICMLGTISRICVQASLHASDVLPECAP